MDKKYFAYIDGEQAGPYELNQLIDAGVHPSTYVWCKGMDDWRRADEVSEIRDLFLHHLNKKIETSINEPEPETVIPEEVIPEKEAQSPPRFRMNRFGVDLPEPDQIASDTSQPPQISMAVAVLTFLFCFWPAGIPAMYFTYKARKTWMAAKDNEELRKKAHDYARLAKMWIGLSISIGLIVWAVLLSYYL